MYAERDLIGCCYVDGKEALYTVYDGLSFTRLGRIEILLQNQFKNGGFSANRLRRLRENQRSHYLDELAEKMVELFYDKPNNKSKISNLIICGPAEFKIEMSENPLVRQFFNNEANTNCSTRMHIITMESMDYDKFKEYADQIPDPTETLILDKIKEMIRTDDHKLLFGNEITTGLLEQSVQTIYCSLERFEQLNQIIKDEGITEPEMIRIKSSGLDQYGGMIGVKWF
jgi:hypothetical protein